MPGAQSSVQAAILFAALAAAAPVPAPQLSGLGNLGSLLGGALPTGGLGNLGSLLGGGSLPTGGLGELESILGGDALPTGGLGNLGSLLGGGALPTGGIGDLASLLGGGSLPSGGLGDLGSLLSGGALPTGGLGNLGSLLGGGALPTGALGGLESILGGGLGSGLSLPTLGVRDPNAAPASLTEPAITEFPTLAPGSGLPTGLPTGLPSDAFPTGLPGLPSGISFPGGIPTGMPSDFSFPGGLSTGFPSGISFPGGVPTGLPFSLPSDFTGFPEPTAAPAAVMPGSVSGFPAEMIDLPLEKRQLGQLLSMLQGLSLDSASPTGAGGLGGILSMFGNGGSLPSITGLTLPAAATGQGSDQAFSFPAGSGFGGFSLPAGSGFGSVLPQPTGGFGSFSLPISGFGSGITQPTGGFGGGSFSFPAGSGIGSSFPEPTGSFGGASAPISEFPVASSPAPEQSSVGSGGDYGFTNSAPVYTTVAPVSGTNYPHVTDIPDFTPLSYIPPVTTPTAASTLRRVIRRDFSSGTQNGLTDGTGCKAVSLIFARGTSETGNMGTVVGPPLASALAEAVGSDNLAVQGVDYAASVAGAIEGGDPDGASTMAKLATNAMSDCPNTQVVLAGYSQGAQVVHLAAKDMDASVASKIAAVTVFGDPYNGQSITNIDDGLVKTFCAQGDEVCAGMFIITSAHLSYGSDAPAAASFIKGKISV